MFITSHGLLLLEVNRAPHATVKELAARAGLTERQTHRVLADLVEAGYLERRRVGRRNHYSVDSGQPMRHPSVRNQRIGELLDVLGRAPSPGE
jgi:DNA-binding transcriptional ArsR family regulator